MADLLSSQLLAIQGAVAKAQNNAELRRRQDPVLKLLLDNQDFMMNDPRSVKESTKRPVKAYFRKKMTADNATARSHNFSGTQTDSVELSLSWYTFAEQFSIALSSGADNIYPTPENILFSIEEKQRIIRERIGLDFVTKLHANRSQVAVATPRLMTWDSTLKAYKNASASVNNVPYNIASIMRQHYYAGPFDVLVDPLLKAKFDSLKAQGSGNSTNQDYQFGSFANVMEHTALGQEVAMDVSFVGGAAIAMPQKSVSVLPWIPKKYRDGFGETEMDTIGIGTTIPDLSGLPITYTLRGFSAKADTTGQNGDVDDVITYWQMSVDMSFNISPLSTANETPIIEFGQL